MTAYVKAASQAMINTMNPDEGSIVQITQWFDCHYLSMIGVPSSVSGCQFRSNISNFKKSIENIISIIDQAALLGNRTGIPSVTKLNELRDQLIDNIINELKIKGIKEIKDILPASIQEILMLLDQDVNDAVLNQYFTKAESISPRKGLIMIPDMSERIKAEMHLTANGKFDPNKYAVAYNAVLLAKLALLDKSGFEQLALAANSKSYINYMPGFENLVASAFSSLDGNHQWMPIPPPRPNAQNIYAKVDYSYASDAGFLLWKDDMRDKLFRRLFIGPLSPGIDYPMDINFPNIVPEKYPYKPCVTNPFPNGLDDLTCLYGSNWNRIMNWAEVVFPELFPKISKNDMTIPPYNVRYYSSNKTYLGYNPNDDHFYGYNPMIWGPEIIKFGVVSDYFEQAKQAGY
jgi:hypothetical protein